MELEISKNVLMDIAATTLERIEGLEIALAPMKAAEVLKSGGSLGSMKAEYDKSWAFVRVRVVATAFQSLFGWPLPEI